MVIRELLINQKILDLILTEFNQKIDLIISLYVPREIVEKRILDGYL